jgi:hypothetical protein
VSGTSVVVVRVLSVEPVVVSVWVGVLVSGTVVVAAEVVVADSVSPLPHEALPAVRRASTDINATTRIKIRFME